MGAISKGIIVDILDVLIVAFLLCRQAAKWDYKLRVARKFVADMVPRFAMNREYALTTEPVDLDAPVA